MARTSDKISGPGFAPLCRRVVRSDACAVRKRPPGRALGPAGSASTRATAGPAPGRRMRATPVSAPSSQTQFRGMLGANAPRCAAMVIRPRGGVSSRERTGNGA